MKLTFACVSCAEAAVSPAAGDRSSLPQPAPNASVPVTASIGKDLVRTYGLLLSVGHPLRRRRAAQRVWITRLLSLPLRPPSEDSYRREGKNGERPDADSAMRHHRFPPRVLLGVALAGAVLAGCGGSDDEGAGKAKAPTPAEAPTAPGTVAMQDVQFIPARMTVRVGQTVTWRNDESLDHNVVAQAGANFQSRAFGQGATYTFTPKKPGRIKYVCTLHPGMDGELVVRG